MGLRKFKDKEEDYYYFKLHKDDGFKFIYRQQRIEKRIIEGKPIPVKYYNEMMAMLREKDDDKDSYYEAIRAEKEKETISYLTSITRSKFDFSIQSKDYDIPIGKRKRSTFIETSSLKRMIEISTHRAIELFLEDVSERNFIRECYKEIHEYISKHEQTKEQYSHYKIGIVVGYLLYAFEYSTKKKIVKNKHKESTPKTGELFNMVKDYIEDFNEKQ